LGARSPRHRDRHAHRPAYGDRIAHRGELLRDLLEHRLQLFEQPPEPVTEVTRKGLCSGAPFLLGLDLVVDDRCRLSDSSEGGTRRRRTPALLRPRSERQLQGLWTSFSPFSRYHCPTTGRRGTQALPCYLNGSKPVSRSFVFAG